MTPREQYFADVIQRMNAALAHHRVAPYRIVLTQEVTHMTSLKQQLLTILSAVSAVAGVPVRAALAVAIWAIGKWVPDAVEGETTPPTVGAAPDNVKSTLRDMFDKAIAMIPNAFYRRMTQSAANLVLDYFIDTAWDAMAQVVTFSAPAPETDADKAAAAALESAAP